MATQKFYKKIAKKNSGNCKKFKRTSQVQYPRVSLGVDEVKELLASLRVVTEHPQHGRGNRLTVDLLDSSHYHAHMSVKKYNKLHQQVRI